MKAAEIFIDTLPDRPRCSDDLRYGLQVRGKHQAAKMRLIQPNTPMVKRWLTFDIDRDDSYFAYEQFDIPVPNFIAVNKGNGHAHYGYLLRSPVLCFDLSSGKPQRYLQSLRNGLTKRLGADVGYTETVCKNPVHEDWETEWNIHRPYEIAELFDCLDKRDLKQKNDKAQIDTSLGRNCAIFESVRHVAYKNVLPFQEMPHGFDSFMAFVNSAAVQANTLFPNPLSLQEIHNIVKSISKWTWQRFSAAEFSEKQKRRSVLGHLARWGPKKALIPDMGMRQKGEKPWETLGMSRATWYRNRKK
jgi:hypothetical protein